MQEARARRERRWGGSRLGLMALLLAGSLPAGSRSGPTPEGDAVVKKMLLTYQNALSIRETTEAKIVNPGEREFIQKTSFLYKRPNLLKLTSQDPQTGTMETYADGKTVTIFSGKQNIFSRRNAPPDLPRIVGLAERTWQDSLNIPTTQILSPVSFLMAKNTLRECRRFRYAGADTIQGRSVVRVAGTADLDWFRNALGVKDLQVEKTEIVLWIDPKTSLLIKASFRALWKTTALVNGETKAVMGGIGFEELHNGTVLNQPLNDADFLFSAPKGAKQIFQQGREKN